MDLHVRKSLTHIDLEEKGADALYLQMPVDMM